MELLERYDWPGNIRELENVIERAVALEATPTILPESLPPAIRGDGAAAPAPATSTTLPEAGFDLEAHVKEIERGYIAQALERAGGVQVQGGGAARHELPVVPLLREEIQPPVSDKSCRRPTTRIVSLSRAAARLAVVESHANVYNKAVPVPHDSRLRLGIAVAL